MSERTPAVTAKDQRRRARHVAEARAYVTPARVKLEQRAQRRAAAERLREARQRELNEVLQAPL